MTTRYVQFDRINDVNSVTGQLLTNGALDPTTFPSNRRFINMGEDITTPMPGGSTVIIHPDSGQPILPYGPTITVIPPAAPPSLPVSSQFATTQSKLDQILALLQKT